LKFTQAYYYDAIEEFNVDWKAEWCRLISNTRNQKQKNIKRRN